MDNKHDLIAGELARLLTALIRRYFKLLDGQNLDLVVSSPAFLWRD